MNVVIVQFDIAWEDKPANHKKIHTLLTKATVAPNSLIILPEMFDTGFSMNVDATAQDDSRESESFLKRLADAFRSAVLGGVIGRTRDGDACNQAVAFSPEGEELVRYQKMQPFTPLGEDRVYQAGDRHEIFEWEGVKIAPFICYDLRFPEIFRQAAKDGAEFLPVIASWPAARSEHWVRLLQARAIENQAYVVGVNRCGTDPGLRFDGRSVVFDPMGQSMFEADENEQVVATTIDAESIRSWRNEFPALQDMRT